MKRLPVIYILLIVSLSVFWSCDPNASNADISDIMTLSVSEITLDESAKTADFGTVMVGKASTAEVTVKNTSSASITIKSISNDNTSDFTVESDITPFTIEPDAEAGFSVAFTPSTNGSLTASVTITLDTEGLSENITLKGSGNYAPSAVFGITVSGAETYTGINGFYTKETDSYISDNGIVEDDDRPLYKMTSNGIDYFLYYFDSGDGYYWGINDVELVFEDPYYEEDPAEGALAYIYTEPVNSYYPPEEDPYGESLWMENYYEEGIEDYTITVKTGVTRTDTILSANYKFVDPDNDTEETSTYQWYNYTPEVADDPVNGDYEAILGATSKTYDIGAPLETTYFKVSVTPVDSNGFKGSETTSDPYSIYIIPQ